MARPKGSKNKPKNDAAPKDETAAPQASGGPGHNRPELTDDEKRVLLLQGLRKIESFSEAMASINSKRRLEFKRLKADGFAKAEIDYALFLRKSTDEEALEKRQREADVARWLKHAVGHQADIFGDGKDRTPSIEVAYEAGKTAGIVGEVCKVPERWSEASEQGQRWMVGWHDGQALLLSDNIKLLQERHDSEAADVSDEQPEGGEVLPGADDAGGAGYELRH